MNFYEDKIEAYLTGKLNAADKLTLEEGMRKDPLLKNEVDLQNDIIESLKNSRKIQLKNRLNNIDVTTTSTGVSSAVKIAASFITVGIIGAGVYYMTVVSSKDKQKENVTVVMNENLQAPDLKEENIKNTSATTLQKDAVNNTNKVNQNNSASNTGTSKENKSSKNSQNVVAHANVPNGIIADTESDRINRDATVDVPNGSIGETSVGKAENVDVNISDKNKKDFSYQYYSNKLFLYGDFNDQPYNLFEVNTPKSKQLYLYYDGKYYELKSHQNKVTRLKEVKDSSVLKHLNK
jgi:hypothetical protein